MSTSKSKVFGEKNQALIKFQFMAVLRESQRFVFKNIEWVFLTASFACLTFCYIHPIAICSWFWPTFCLLYYHSLVNNTTNSKFYVIKIIIKLIFGIGILTAGGTLACYDFLGEKVIIVITIFVFAIICLQWLYFRCIKTIAMFFMSDDDCNYNNQMNWTWISMIYPCLMTSFYIVIGQSPLSTILNPSYALYDWNDLSQFASLFGINSICFIQHWFAILVFRLYINNINGKYNTTLFSANPNIDVNTNINDRCESPCADTSIVAMSTIETRQESSPNNNNNNNSKILSTTSLNCNTPQQTNDGYVQHIQHTQHMQQPRFDISSVVSNHSSDDHDFDMGCDNKSDSNLWRDIKIYILIMILILFYGGIRLNCKHFWQIDQTEWLDGKNDVLNVACITRDKTRMDIRNQLFYNNKFPTKLDMIIFSEGFTFFGDRPHMDVVGSHLKMNEYNLDSYSWAMDYTFNYLSKSISKTYNQTVYVGVTGLNDPYNHVRLLEVNNATNSISLVSKYLKGNPVPFVEDFPARSDDPKNSIADVTFRSDSLGMFVFCTVHALLHFLFCLLCLKI